MKKVKIIAKEQYPFLEEAINDFVKDKTVLDIQYADTPTFVSALIVYDEPSVEEIKDRVLAMRLHEAYSDAIRQVVEAPENKVDKEGEHDTGNL